MKSKTYELGAFCTKSIFLKNTVHEKENETQASQETITLTTAI